jgi:hypothetical protein
MALSSGCSFFVNGPPGDYRPETHGAPACNRCARDILTSRTARCREAQDRFIVWAHIRQVPVRQLPVAPLPAN